MAESNSTTRQSNLFAIEDWKKVYQTFREADFQSYDFETLRKTMIDYLRTYYPEDFNDFIESSEYIALIDLIAFLGQSLAFRVDLNSRENFLETAERRDSVLRLARMLSYFPKRSQVARGLLKFDSVSTTENVFDSNGNNLANNVVIWNDVTNPDFFEQFTLVMNATLQSTQRFGKPAFKALINGINTEEYEMNIIPQTTPLFAFNRPINGRATAFELVSGSYSGTDYIYEPAPIPGNTFNLIYRNDGRGNESINTGFFVYFKQGGLQSLDFNIPEKIANRVVNIDVNNVDNNDIWLFGLDDTGNADEMWKKVPAITGSNVIFNNISNEERNLFAVNSRENDQVDLVFADDVFANIPVGNYRTLFRTGNGLTYKVPSDDMQNVTVDIPYLSRTNQLETLTLTLSLQQTIANANARESLEDVKRKAPQQFYTQNRMITGEDYNIFPLTSFNDIVKVKAVNRTSSGISRFFDVRDPTGKYSNTNIFGEDGALYRFEEVLEFNFEFINQNDILNVIANTIEPILRDKESLHFYYKNYPQINIENLETSWNQSTTGTNLSTGFVENSSGNPQGIGEFTGGNLQFAVPDSLLKFVAPSGFHFKSDGTLGLGAPTIAGETSFIWSKVINIIDDGTNGGVGNLLDGTGPVTLNQVVPTGALLTRIIPPFVTNLTPTVEAAMLSNILLFKEFGLSYNRADREWVLIAEQNLNKSNTFNLATQGDISSQGLDNSWFVLFENDGETFTVKYRSLSYIFESVLETRFYFEKTGKIFDPTTGKSIIDNVKVLKINTAPDALVSLGVDFNLQIDNTIVEADGFSDNVRIKVTFADSDDDGVPDNPEMFELIVAPTINSLDKLVFFERFLDDNGFDRWRIIDTALVNIDYQTQGQINFNLAQFEDGRVFYATTEDDFYVLTVNNQGRVLTQSFDYFARTGRKDLFFQYTHNTPNFRRVDPSPSNIIDLFVLTRQYDIDYREYVNDLTETTLAPELPTSSSLRESFGSLEDSKAISDALVFAPAQFLPLFGSKASPSLQAKFKIVKNPTLLLSDSQIKVSLIAKINEYFALNNWDFGDTFFFSELAAWLHTQLSPQMQSIVIVPVAGDQRFGSLFQITSQSDEIFISAATVSDVEVIDAITASKIRATGTVLNSTDLISGDN